MSPETRITCALEARRQPLRSAGPVRRLAARLVSVVALSVGVVFSVNAQVNVTTYQYNNQRSGVNGNETILTQANVNSALFGRLFSQSVDGYVYAQPLYVANVAIPAEGLHNVIYIATEHDSVYAFDADSNAGANAQPLWHTSFLSAGVTTVPSDASHLNTTDVNPEVGITGTPVIDLSTGTMYVVAATLENGTTYVQRLHALDITSGAERSGSPVVISASVPGTGNGSNGGTLNFDSQWENQRPGLLLYDGVVYIAFASHGDNGDWHGWLLGYNTSNLQQSFVDCIAPNGFDGGIWMSGQGPAMDSGSNLFFVTGNGTFDSALTPPVDFGDSILRIDLSKGPTVQDYFTPWNQNALDSGDIDLGSGGVLILPDQPGAHPHLLVQAGKQGNVYILNRDPGAMGHFSSSANNIVQELDAAVGGMWASPVYFNGRIYFWGSGDNLKAFSIANGTVSSSPADQSSVTFGFPGATPTISANGISNAILWALQTDAFSDSGPGGTEILRAYNPASLGAELYDSNMDGTRDQPGGAIKFAVPTVVNGKVYVGAERRVSVYGLLAAQTQTAAPVFAPGSGTYASPQSVIITSATSNATIFYTTDGTSPSTNSSQYAGPVSINSTETLKAIATATGLTPSAVTSASYNIQVPGPAASFSPASLLFVTESVGASGGTQTVTLTNTGGKTLSIATVSIAGANSTDFSETNNCGTSVLAGGSCAISVKFAPAAAGSRSATLLVTDNAANSPQGASLSGTGIDFSITPQAGSSTVSAGQAANYTLQLSALGGRGGDQLNLTVSCSGAPPKASCAAPIGPLTVTTTAPAAVSISVITVANAAVASPPGFDPRPDSGTREFVLGMLLLVGLLWLMSGNLSVKPGVRRVAAASTMPLVLLGIAIAFMIGCGTNRSTTASQNNGTPPGTYTLTVTATSGILTHSTLLTLIVK